MKLTKTTLTVFVNQSSTTFWRMRTKWDVSEFNKFWTSPSLGETTSTKVSSPTKSGNTMWWWQECWCQRTFAFAARPLWNWCVSGARRTTTRCSLCSYPIKTSNPSVSNNLRTNRSTRSTKFADSSTQNGQRALLTFLEKSLKILISPKQKPSSTRSQP